LANSSCGFDSSSVATSQKLKKKSLGHSVEIILFPWNLKQVEKHFHNWSSLKFAHFVEVFKFWGSSSPIFYSLENKFSTNMLPINGKSFLR
jgi:hypothetical protein